VGSEELLVVQALVVLTHGQQGVGLVVIRTEQRITPTETLTHVNLTRMRLHTEHHDERSQHPPESNDTNQSTNDIEELIHVISL
jgi:hypothetical protein